eukprot:TRINITY_DN45146_c0_g1_i1.p1 TRINITY_DN45146_c0_g1~~TRINITY_DN45146_c0_g1_i1.p1  ORF type:complete len:214 (+),score=20.33 TRINITY_DN45146_c0_g1_i1:98-643(+)
MSAAKVASTATADLAPVSVAHHHHQFDGESSAPSEEPMFSDLSSDTSLPSARSHVSLHARLPSVAVIAAAMTAAPIIASKNDNDRIVSGTGSRPRAPAVTALRTQRLSNVRGGGSPRLPLLLQRRGREEPVLAGGSSLGYVSTDCNGMTEPNATYGYVPTDQTQEQERAFDLLRMEYELGL